jgi:hypothetical protein
MAELGAFFGNPNVQRQGARARALAAQRDVNTLPDPLTYAVVQGLLGTRPDEMGFSVLNPDYEKIRKAAEPAFALGLIGQASPLLAPITKGLPVGASIKNVGKNINVGLKEESNFLSAKSKFGEVGGTIRQPDRLSDKPYLQINYAEVEQASRGTGKGKELYKALIDEAESMGLRVFSDSTVEKSAVNVYKSLEKGGYKLKDMTKGSLEDGAVYGSGAEKPAFEISNKQKSAPRQEALDTAQRNAALPVEEGGLGLPKDNTPEMRAQAMGFDLNNPQYHATDADFTSIRPSARGKMGAGIYTSPEAKYAEKYGGNQETRTLPMVSRGEYADADTRENIFDMVRGDLYLKNPNFTSQELNNAVSQEMQRKGYSGFDVDKERVTFSPDEMRSRFAAFDPFRMNTETASARGVAPPDLLAGVLPLGLLADEEQRKKLYELMPSLLGQ